MKKFLTILGLVAFTLASFSCSSSDSNTDEIVSPKEDFTNPEYIKKLMVGEWDITAVKLSSESESDWRTFTAEQGKLVYFIFKTDGTYERKSIFEYGDSDSVVRGTYTITGATTENNATIDVKYSLNGKAYTVTYILKSYENNEVRIHYYSPISKLSLNEKYKKQ